MGLLVALDDNKQAAGELFWDDGDSRGVLPKIVHVLFIWLIYICPFRLLNFIVFFVSRTETVETGKHIHYLFSVSSVCFLFLPHKFIFTIQFSPYPVWNCICWLGSLGGWVWLMEQGCAGVMNLRKSATIFIGPAENWGDPCRLQGPKQPDVSEYNHPWGLAPPQLLCSLFDQRRRKSYHLPATHQAVRCWEKGTKTSKNTHPDRTNLSVQDNLKWQKIQELKKL